MLEDIAYLGHELTGVNFELLIKEPQGEGFYNYSLEVGPDIALTSLENTESPTHTIRLSLVSTVKGFSGTKEQDSNEEPEGVFNLEVRFDILFELEGEAPTSDFLDENQWYFVNFGHVASKELAYSILDNSTLKGAYLPSHRIGQRD